MQRTARVLLVYHDWRARIHAIQANVPSDPSGRRQVGNTMGILSESLPVEKSMNEPNISLKPAVDPSPPQPAPDSPPLRSLNRYREDPAFQNFQDRLRRPPGVGASKARRRPTLDVPRGKSDR